MDVWHSQRLVPWLFLLFLFISSALQHSVKVTPPYVYADTVIRYRALQNFPSASTTISSKPHRQKNMSILPTLESTCMNLSTQVETAMAALYCLEGALVNARPTMAEDIHRLISPLKDSLKADWESIAEFLEDCYNFGASLVKLKLVIKGGSPEECLKYLLAITKDFQGSLTDSESLLIICHSRSETLASLAPTFLDWLQNPVIIKPEDKHAKQEDPTRVFNALSDFDRKTQTLINTLYPDGNQALPSAQLALQEIPISLRLIQQFWRIGAQMSKDILNLEILSAVPHGVIESITQFAPGWKARKEALLSAIVSITRSCDAISIRTNGALSLYEKEVKRPLIKSSKKKKKKKRKGQRA